MKREINLFRSKSIGFIIIATCVTIVLVLVVSLFVANFSNFRTSTSTAVSSQTRELSAQIVYNYESYIGSIIETSNIIQTDIDQYDVSLSKGTEEFSAYLQEIIHLKSDIIKISVYGYSVPQCIASSDPDELGKIYDLDDSEWFSEAVNDPTVHVFSVPYSETGSDEYKVNVSKRIKLQNGSVQGVLKIEISFQRFIELVEKSNLGEGGHITIIDPAYNIVYTSLDDSSEAQKEIAPVQKLVLGSENMRLGEHSLSVNVDTLSNTKWRICVFINVDNLTEIETGFLRTTLLVSAFVLFIAIFLFTAVARTITSPLKRLELAMRKVEKSDYFRMEEVDITASKEVEALTRRFNKMMLKISELMARVIAEQDAQRKSELKALQNQINPHFLYNTLDSIVWLIENQKNAEASEMVVALAKLFRIGISKETEVIPLREELEHVRNYLLIQNIRYADSFDYEFDVAEEALDAMTMKLILQPMVENCIYHGLKNKIDKGHIIITARLDGDFLEVSVADNGYGMRQETIDALYASFQTGAESNSVGLKNIYQRVIIYFGGGAEMRIESKLDEGTTITIREPLNRL